MKKKFLYVFLFLFVIFLTGCGVKKLNSIALIGDNEVAVNSSITIEVVKMPTDAKADQIKWISSDESVLKVNDGVVIGVGVGRATVIAKVSDDIKSSKDIDVFAATESISIDKSDISLGLNQDEKISVVIEPNDSSYTLSSSDSSVAIVSSEGVINSVNYGIAKIIAKTRDNKEAICTVRVSVVVPNFENMSMSNAKEWGKKNNVNINIDTDYSSSIKKDKLISQSISSGTEIIEKGKIIKLIYSKGKQPTLGELNALKSAKSYLDTMAFSAKGLKKQLEFEGYSSSEAQYAVDNCGADWKEQAAKSAKSYLDTMAFSAKGLKKQLEFEGYSSSEAQYAVDNCGANWNEQAARSAKSYIDIMSFSRSGLKKQLEFEGFTSQQAEYGVKAVGY